MNSNDEKDGDSGSTAKTKFNEHTRKDLWANLACQTTISNGTFSSSNVSNDRRTLTGSKCGAMQMLQLQFQNLTLDEIIKPKMTFKANTDTLQPFCVSSCVRKRANP